MSSTNHVIMERGSDYHNNVNMDDDKVDIVGGELLVVDNKRYCCGKLSRKQFIWLLIILVILMIIIIVAVLLILFVGGKAIAQSGLNSSSINIDEMIIGNQVNCNDNNNAVLCLENEMKISVKSDSMSSTILSSRNYIYIDNNELGYVNLPDMDVAGHTTTKFNNKGILYITNKSYFDKFGEDIMLMDSVILNMKGKIDIKALGIKYSGLNFDKNIILTGYNNFTNIIAQTTEDIKPFLPNDELKKKYWTDVPGVINAIYSYSTVAVPNPTVMTISNIGNISGDLYYNNVKIGISQALNGTSLKAKSVSYVNNLVVLQSRNETVDTFSKLLPLIVNGGEVILLMHGISTNNNIWIKPVNAMYMPTNATKK